MTRKRFVKLLMAEGEPRNKAQSVARLYNRCKIPYERAYEDYIFANLATTFNDLSKAFQKANDAILALTYAYKRLGEMK